jgi:tyrosine-specific transport protein
MSKEAGSVIGGGLLIAGSCIGAGMLGLPILTGLCGFVPSLWMFFLSWAFMTVTGLLLVEVTGWFPKQVNLISMTQSSLGKWGKNACWIFYLFLFYALLVAYISGCGTLFSTLMRQYFHLAIADWIGSLIFVVLFGWVVYQGTRPVDLWNRVLMLAKIGSFLTLVFLGVRYISPKLLERSAPQYAIFSLPILVISFGFHNMIPSLMGYMKGNVRRTRQSIWLGSLFALVIYLIWQLLVLGIVPLEGESGILQSLKKGEEASQAISGVLGLSAVSSFATLLAFFAILTSFLAQALSLTHFWGDGLKISYKKHENVLLCVLTLVPPLVLAISFPQIFFKALNFAGGICAVILFGILPVLMVWKGRKREGAHHYRVRGGKPLLVAIFLFALFVAFFQISQMAGASYLPKL